MNIIFDSMDIFAYRNNFSKRQFSYNTKIDNNTYKTNYELLYGQYRFNKDWFSRKFSAIPKALYYGILANIIQIFKIVIRDLMRVIFSLPDHVFSKTKNDTDLSKNLNISLLNTYEIAQNLILSLSYLYSLINDKGARFYIDSALMEKRSYSLAKNNQNNLSDQTVSEFAFSQFCCNHLSIHGKGKADTIANVFNNLGPNKVWLIYNHTIEKLINNITEQFSLDEGCTILEALSEKLTPYNRSHVIEKFIQQITGKKYFEDLLSKNTPKDSLSVFAKIIALCDKMKLSEDTKRLPEYSYFIDLSINKIGVKETFNFVSDLPSKQKMKHLIGLCSDPWTDLERLEHFEYFFQKHPDLLGLRFSRFCNIFQEENSKIANFLKHLIQKEPKAFEAYLKFSSQFDHFNCEENDEDIIQIWDGKENYLDVKTWVNQQAFIRRLVENNLNTLLIPYAKYLKDISKKLKESGAESLGKSRLLETHQNNKKFIEDELQKASLPVEAYELLSDNNRLVIKTFLLSSKKIDKRTFPQSIKLKIVKKVINSSELEF